MRRRVCVFAALAASLAAAGCGLADSIKSDEEVIFFPSCAWLDPDGTHWNIPVHGWVFEPERNSIKRKMLLAILRKKFDLEEGEADTQRFEERMRMFLVDSKEGKALSVRLGTRTFKLGESSADGHFEGTVRLSVPEVNELIGAGGDAAAAWVPFAAVTRANDRRRFTGSVQLIAPEGVSVISDVDDTIKVTNVADRDAMMRNTFLKEFEATPGLADVYATWSGRGVRFHYVSSGAWQLYPALEAFRSDAGFPAGSFHMRAVGWKATSVANFVGDSQPYKTDTIADLLTKFPKRRFILVGDSGEKDPEVYGEIARRFPEQVVAVYIRNVTKERPDAERFAKAFDKVPVERWTLFEHPDEIRAASLRLPK